MHIPKECSFINAIKQTPIPQELEDTIQINKISDNNNNIFIESEEKKVTSKNKPLENAVFLRKEGELDIYQFPSRKFVIGSSNSSKDDRNECMKISKQINRKILMVVGQTGSGKTTLLNSLINALCGIQLQDDFRYIISGAVNITYFGTFKDDVTTGYKEDNTGIIKYTITDGNCYKIENGENILYDGLYE